MAISGPFALGETLGSGRYQLNELLASGTRKAVYLAHDLRMARDVVVSVLEPGQQQYLHAKLAEEEAKLRGRFADCPRIVSVHDFGMHEGRPFVVSQLMDRGTLADELAPRLNEHLIVQIGTDICEALDYCHERKMVHRNVAPSTIWLNSERRAFLGGFEVAMTIEATNPVQTGFLVSQPHYAPPEAILGDGVGPASDLYSLGASLYEAAYGKPPYQGQTEADVLRAHLDADLEFPVGSEGGVSPQLAQVLERALSKRVPDRYQAAQEMAEALRRVARAETTSLQELIDRGESDVVEFKSSLRYCHDPSVPEEARKHVVKKLEKAVAKAVAAFRNSRGGTLVVGVDDEGQVLGIEYDYETLSKADQDGWWLAFKETTSRLLGDEIASTLVVNFEQCDDRTVAIVQTEVGDDGTWVRDGDSEEFYVRNGPSSVRLTPSDAASYVRRHFPLAHE